MKHNTYDPSLSSKSFVLSLNLTPMLSSLRLYPKPYLEWSTHLDIQIIGASFGSSASSSWDQYYVTLLVVSESALFE